MVVQYFLVFTLLLAQTVTSDWSLISPCGMIVIKYLSLTAYTIRLYRQFGNWHVNCHCSNYDYNWRYNAVITLSASEPSY